MKYKQPAVLLFHHNQGKYLVLNSNKNKCFTLVGGKVEDFETLTEALVREVKEETNMDIDPKYLKRVYNDVLNERDVHVYVYEGILPVEQMEVSEEGIPMFVDEASFCTGKFQAFNIKLIEKLPMYVVKQAL